MICSSLSFMFWQVSAFIVLCPPVMRSSSDEFDQVQQEKFGFFLGASKLGSDW